MENLNVMTANSNEETKLNIGFIGIGNAGSQVALNVYKEGVPIRLINTSVKDLDPSIVPKDIPGYLISDAASAARGAGHSRDNAKKLYKRMSDAILKNATLISFVNDNDVIIVGCSTAGGTGSGIAPTIVYQLKQIYPAKVFVLLGIIPRKSEAPNGQYNTSTFADEVNMLNQQGVRFPYMLYDLERYASVSADDAYKSLAADIAESIKVLAGGYAHTTAHGMIDERDMLTIISEPGLLNVYHKTGIDLSKIPEGGIQSIMIKTIEESPAVKVQKDKQIKWMGIFMNLPEDLDDDVRKANFSTLEEAIGRPWDTFVNHAVTDKPKGDFAIIASGMSFPYDRISECVDIVKGYTEAAKTKSFSIHEEIATAKDFAKNDNVEQILGSKAMTIAEDLPDNIAMPSFLDPDF